jgi:hypothetical protein
MRLVHCERCRFNFESDQSPAHCPQCHGPGVPAEHAARPERETSRTQELKIIPPEPGEDE